MHLQHTTTGSRRQDACVARRRASREGDSSVHMLPSARETQAIERRRDGRKTWSQARFRPPVAHRAQRPARQPSSALTTLDEPRDVGTREKSRRRPGRQLASSRRLRGRIAVARRSQAPTPSASLDAYDIGARLIRSVEIAPPAKVDQLDGRRSPGPQSPETQKICVPKDIHSDCMCHPCAGAICDR